MMALAIMAGRYYCEAIILSMIIIIVYFSWGPAWPPLWLMGVWLVNGHCSKLSYLLFMTTKNRDKCVFFPMPSPKGYKRKHTLYPYLLV